MSEATAFFEISVSSKDFRSNDEFKRAMYSKAEKHCGGKRYEEHGRPQIEPGILISEGIKLPNETYFWNGTFSCKE